MWVCVYQHTIISINRSMRQTRWKRDGVGETAHDALRRRRRRHRHRSRHRRRPLRILFNIIWINLQAGGFHNKIVYTCQISIDFETSEIAQFNLENDFFAYALSLSLALSCSVATFDINLIEIYYSSRKNIMRIGAWYVWNIFARLQVLVQSETERRAALDFLLCRSDFLMWKLTWLDVK